MLGDTRERYGSVSRFFHWLMSVLLIWQFLRLGHRINDGEHWIGETLVPWHVSIGVTLLVLIVLRMLWVSTQLDKRPLADPVHPVAVRTGHFLLYAAMLLMPVTGILYMLGKGYGLKVFGMQLVARGTEVSWALPIGELHSPIAWFLLVMVLGHIGIALYHHFIKRDQVLRRML
ncbi:MAG: cytochrome b [Xanthomonadaceae bacterium]|nr:cytochrome b [Xanthomonadaceae bacterium]